MSAAKVKNLIVSRIVSAIELEQFKEITDGSIATRRMFAQRNIRKALSNTPDEDITALYCMDVYDIAAAIGDGGSIFGEWVNRAIRYGVNGYYYSI